MSSQGQSLEPSSTDTILEMIEGFWVSRANYVAAKFGIPDLLKSGPNENEQLAQLMGLHAPSLYRLMRAGNTRFSKFMDLAVLVMTGGRERTEAEYRRGPTRVSEKNGTAPNRGGRR
jgi:hypothetical protein